MSNKNSDTLPTTAGPNEAANNNSTTTSKKSPSLTTKLKQVVASSSCGAIITALLMTPLDVVKIRLQAQNRQLHKGDCYVLHTGLLDHQCRCFNGPNSWYNRQIPGGRYTGTVDALVKIIRAEGPTSLWSGLPPTLLMSFPQVVLYFTSYEQVKLSLGYHELNNPNPLLPILSGGLARVFAVTAVSPLELVRTKMQSERINYTQLSQAVRLTVRADGLASLYRGWVSTVWRDVPFSMVYWLFYEKLKTAALLTQHETTLSNLSTFACGAAAGSVAATLTTPLDVVKTYRQIQLGQTAQQTLATPAKTLDIIRQIYAQKGFTALFAGITPRVTKVALSCAVMITTFEYFKRIFD